MRTIAPTAWRLGSSPTTSTRSTRSREVGASHHMRAPLLLTPPPASHTPLISPDPSLLQAFTPGLCGSTATTSTILRSRLVATRTAGSGAKRASTRSPTTQRQVQGQGQDRRRGQCPGLPPAHMMPSPPAPYVPWCPLLHMCLVPPLLRSRQFTKPWRIPPGAEALQLARSPVWVEALACPTRRGAGAEIFRGIDCLCYHNDADFVAPCAERRG